MMRFPLPGLTTLRSRMLLSSGVFLAIVLLVMGALAFVQGREALREVQATNLATIATRITTDIDDRIRTRHVLLEQAAAGLQLNAGEFSQQAITLVTQFRYLKGMFNSVILYDVEGNIVADYPPLPGRRGVNVADRDYFMQTKQRLLPQVSEPVRGRGGLNRTVIVFTAPVFDRLGQLAGVMGGSLELYSPEFFGELKNINIGQGGYLTINSRLSRTTIMHTDPAFVMQPSPGADTSPALHRAFAGWEGHMIDRNRQGKQALLVYRSLDNAPWVLGVVMPLREVLSPMYEIGWRLAGVIAITLLLALPVWWWSLSRQMLPLLRLKQQVATLQQSPTSSLPMLGCDELQSIAEDVALAFRQRAETLALLGEREALFRTLNDVSPMGVIVVNAGGMVQYINPASLRVGGLPVNAQEQWQARRWLDAVHPESLPKVVQMWQELLASGRGFDLLCRLHHKEGRVVMAELRFVEIGNIAGERRFLGLLSDVSARETAQAGLIAERERAQVVLATITDAVVLTNQMDEIEYANPPALAMFGLPASDMLGRFLGVFVNLVRPDTGLPITLRELEREHAGKEVELDLQCRDMYARPVVLTLSVITGPGPMHGYKVVVLHDDTERRQRERQHRWEANHDVLTGLYNRRGLLAALSGLLQDEAARQQPNVLVVMDLDHFKQVNDTGGHQCGDLLLQDIAAILLRHVRSTDVVARLGGDEFAILLLNCPVEIAECHLQKILQDIDAHVLKYDGQAFRVTASIGFSLINAADVRPQTIISRADAACYAAKRQGRNCITSLGDIAAV